jgi:hypothetical protein
VQTEGDVHATPLRKPPGDEGVGTGWICRFVPFHRSAKTPTGVPELLKEFPVAVQADGDVQDTLANVLGAAPLGLGVGWMRHRLPFHRSARVWGMPERSMENPAAVQADGDGQATLFRGANWAPAGVGVGWMRHRVPFQRSPAPGFLRPPRS